MHFELCIMHYLGHAVAVVLVGEFAEEYGVAFFGLKPNGGVLDAIEHVGFHCGIVVHIAEGQHVACFQWLCEVPVSYKVSA